MWGFAGSIKYRCIECLSEDEIPVKDFEIECISASERGMGAEQIYELICEVDCWECNSLISLNFEITEYPIGVINFIQNDSVGAETFNTPDIEYLEEIYSITDEELLSVTPSVQQLIAVLQDNPELVRDIEPREFEEVICEIFRAQGFEVELTPMVADGGVDIIAIQKNSLGINTRYFIECKRYAEANKIGVDIVRKLHGVKTTKGGSNKTILVTTSSFTSGARNFVKNEIPSTWDMELIDFEVLKKWFKDYVKSDF